jgi:hypothetical protein
MNISSDHGKTLSALKNLKAAFPKGKTALLLPVRFCSPGNTLRITKAGK